MRVFVTGITGQLGYDCLREFVKRKYEVIGSARNAITEADAFSVQVNIADQMITKTVPYIQLDITNEDEVHHVIEAVRPDVIVHCAAWTNVDGAELPENREKVFDVNSIGTEYIAKAAKANAAKMVYISTDYIFGGSSKSPWQPDDEGYGPLNVYGKSKLDGEIAVRNNVEKLFIIRTSWMFGINGKNFVKTMISAGKKNDAVCVVNDQIGTPTYTVDLAKLIADMVETEKYGCYHVTNEGGYISWYDFCREIYRQYDLKTKVVPVSTEEYGLNIAARPLNSRLDKSKLLESGFTPLPNWRDAVRRYFQEEQF